MRQTAIRLETTFCGKPVLIWRPRWKRHLEFLGGKVGLLVPVVLTYRGQKKRAQKEAQRLKRYGYRVKMRREKPQSIGTARPGGRTKAAASATPAGKLQE